jgi:ABC-2 type transport system ATP-binding protein
MVFMLCVTHVTKVFGDFTADSDVSFDVPEGRVVGVLGPNGAGKSTLLHIISGLLQPTEGTVNLDGTDIGKYGSKLYEKLSCVFEDSSLAYMTIPGWENLRYLGALYGLTKKQTFARADKLLDILDLKQHMNKRVGDWSRGTQQKLALVAATLIRPEVLILDEPTLGLDVVSKRDFLNAVKQMTSEGMSVVLASHQSEVIEWLADDIVLLSHGNVRWQGSLDTFITGHSTNPAQPEKLESILLEEFDKEFMNTDDTPDDNNDNNDDSKAEEELQ